ncbi:MAG: Coenzyme F420 hydrogenase/dehydrogenase, beta subunit C-terminal domain [Promethearchaeota archaeon]
MESKGTISWNFLKVIADTLDSYRIRNLIDAKNDIISSGIYDEDQYYQILFQMIDEERMKYSLFNYLNTEETHNLKSLKQYSKENSIDIKKTLSFLELLRNEGLIKVDYIYNNVDPNEGNSSDLAIKDLLVSSLHVISSEVKSIYEPVKVIYETNNCSGCGLCAGICPVNCINIYNGFGKIEEDKCIRCGLCYYFCPRTYLPVKLLNMTQKNTSKLENFPKIGHYLEVYSARTKIKEISEVCQDGGITSTCLHFLFERNEIDIALGAQMSRTLWRPEPLLIKRKEDILKAAGTKYVNNPTLSLLNKLNENSSNLAIVGVPCMMQALLKSEIYNIGIPSLNKVKYRIGIFCMESFSYESLLKICETLSVNINNVRKSDINKGKFFVYTHEGKQLSIPIKEISHLAREDCEMCFDLTSESADISIGSIGAPSGWNTVIIRTPKGKELFDGLIKNDLIEFKEITEVQPGLPMVEKIANSKRNKCSKHIAKKEGEEKRTPIY